MSYNNFDERTLSSSLARNGFTTGSVTYSTGASFDQASAGSSAQRATTSQIASDLLLGANAVGVSGGANAGSVSYSTSYSTGAGASAGSALALGNSSAYVLGAGAGAAFVSGA
ncbi:unnamed protein product, partial [Brachionus calyciflorus]